MPNIDLSILNQRQTPAFYADTLANRPAAGFVGRIFVSTNTFAFYRDNGTGWDLIGGPGTGTITGSGVAGRVAIWDGASTINSDSGFTFSTLNNAITAGQYIVSGGTSTQFLKGDGSLDSNTYNTGSGAVGQVTFWNGTNAITGGNDLFWDSVNGHLGVNTNVPGTALDVHHDQPTVAILNQTVATNDVRIGFQNNGVGLWRIGAFYNAGANDFGIYDAVAAIQPVTVKKTTGQVLIGTSTVGSGKLVVASSTGDNGVQIVGASAPSLRIDNAESGPTKRAGFGISTATNNFIQGSADRDFCMFNGSTTASPILFGIYGTTNVQEAARISAARNFLVGTTTDAGQKLQINGDSYLNGNVGIGIINPLTKLHVEGTSTQLIRVSSSSFSTFQQMGVTTGGTFLEYKTLYRFVNTDLGEGARLSDINNFLIGTTGEGADGLGLQNQKNVSFVEGGGESYVNVFRQRNSAAGVLAQGLKRSLTGEWASSLSGASARSAVVVGYNAGSIAFYADNTTTVPNGTDIVTTPKMLLQNTGNLLIGTTTDNGTRLQNNGNFCTGNEIYGFSTSSFVRISGGGSNVGGASVLMFGEASSSTPGRIAVSAVGTQPIEFYAGGALRFSMKSNGTLNSNNMPTSAAGLVSGDIYSNLGVLTIVP